MEGMNDLIIYKIAPLCPFLYITLRATCRKFRKALPLDDKMVAFLRWSRYYHNQFDLLFYYVSSMRFRFVEALYPRLRGIYLATHLGYLGAQRILLVNKPHGMQIERDLGQLSQADFFEFTCEMFCCLKCSGSDWSIYYDNAHTWTMSYDTVVHTLVFQRY
jgi:hypothetical protein